jgi:hypothetical protein
MSIRRCMWGVLTLLLVGLIAGARADELLYTSSMVEYFSSEGLALSVPYIRLEDSFLAKVEVPLDLAPGGPGSGVESDVFDETGTAAAYWAAELLAPVEHFAKPPGRQ